MAPELLEVLGAAVGWDVVDDDVPVAVVVVVVVDEVLVWVDEVLVWVDEVLVWVLVFDVEVDVVVVGQLACGTTVAFREGESNVMLNAPSNMIKSRVPKTMLTTV